MFDEIRASSHVLHRALDGLAARQRAMSHNIANVDTPAYRPQEIQFEALLQQGLRSAELSQTHARHLPALTHDDVLAYRTQLGIMGNDGNGVDLEQEITRMSQAQLSYGAVSQMLSGRFSHLKYVISEGAR